MAAQAVHSIMSKVMSSGACAVLSGNSSWRQMSIATKVCNAGPLGTAENILNIARSSNGLSRAGEENWTNGFGRISGPSTLPTFATVSSLDRLFSNRRGGKAYPETSQAWYLNGLLFGALGAVAASSLTATSHALSEVLLMSFEHILLKLDF